MIVILSCLTTLAAAWYLASFDLGIQGQAFLAFGMCGILALIKPFERSLLLRMIAITCAGFISIRYFLWRVTETIPTSNWLSMTLGVMLVMAEGYGIWLYTSGAFVVLRPITRRIVPLPEDSEDLPFVDVYVPSYLEPWDVVGPTLMAAMAMRWPKHKLRIIMCDDGSTDERCNSPIPAKRAAALARRAEMQARCAELGVVYIARKENVGAKAGNLNYAMREISGHNASGGKEPPLDYVYADGRKAGDLVVVFDADHVPTEDFLEHTVGPFIVEERLGLVQTPHFFITADPLEKNLRVHRVMPGDAESFYLQHHRGLDFWNASFFCGSAAVLRRLALDEIGGIQTDTVTEDAHTSMEMHAKGWNSAYIPRPMISGLQPASYSSFVKQRVRWASGMIQIFLMHNPLLKRGLSIPQRLCYTAASGFWFFAFSRLCFLLSPIPYLLFGLEIFKADTASFFVYAVPHIIGSMIMTDILNGRYRWPLISELYELALSVYTFPAIIGTILRPSKPTFVVTAKDESLDKEFMSPLAKPFLAILVFLLVSFGVGIWRMCTQPGILTAQSIVMFWCGFNILMVLGAVGAMFEMVTRRGSPRVDIDQAVNIDVGGKVIAARMTNASIGGANIHLSAAGVILKRGDRVRISFISTSGDTVETECEVRNRRDSTFYGLMFINQSLEMKQAIVSLVHGSSEAWIAESERRTQRLGLIRGIAFFLRLSLVNGTRALVRSFSFGA